MNLFLPMFGVGLVTSVHCVAMCGSMVLTYAVKGQPEGTAIQRMTPHLAYQSAKILSYVVVGLLLGAIGSVLNLGGVRGWITVFAGAFMVLLGLNMTGRFPALRRLTLRPPRFLLNALSSARRKSNADVGEGTASLATPLVFGLLTGLMPCGPLQAAQLAAAGTGSAVSGAIAMLGFGLGTMPLMLGFGTVSGYLGAKFKQRMLVVAALVIVALGFVMLNRGAMLLGSPVTAQTVAAAFTGAPTAAGSTVATGKDGVAEAKLTIRNTQFVPAALTVPADRPFRIVVDRQEDNACSAQLAIPQIGVLANLKADGVTAVDVPATKGGTYTLTCGMGMMAGRLSVGGGAGSSGGTNPTLIVLAGVIAAAGAVYFVKRRGAAVHGTGASAPAGRGGSDKGGTARKGSRSGPGRGSAKGGRPGQPAGRPAPAPAVMFGLTPPEVMAALGAVGAAVAVGLALGGMFGGR